MGLEVLGVERWVEIFLVHCWLHPGEDRVVLEVLEPWVSKQLDLLVLLSNEGCRKHPTPYKYDECEDDESISLESDDVEDGSNLYLLDLFVDVDVVVIISLVYLGIEGEADGVD